MTSASAEKKFELNSLYTKKLWQNLKRNKATILILTPYETNGHRDIRTATPFYRPFFRLVIETSRLKRDIEMAAFPQESNKDRLLGNPFFSLENDWA